MVVIKILFVILPILIVGTLKREFDDLPLVQVSPILGLSVLGILSLFA